MVLAYTTITHEEDLKRNLVDKGDYPFTIKSIIEKPTKSGKNKQLEVDLSLHDATGRCFNVRDWIMLDDENMAWKLRHFCKALGLLEKYEAQTLEVKDFFNRSGVARIGVGDYEKDGESRKVNKVLDYLEPKGGTSNFKDDEDIKF